MLESDKVQSSEQGKAKLREAYKEAGLTIDKLAKMASVSEDTVKRLLGTKECPNGVERLGVKNIAKALGIEPTDIIDPKDWYPQYELPAEFKSVIQEKIKKFCGRQFVFDEIDQFIGKETKGYFTVIGDAGMGKTALAAKLIYDRQYPCYFNILAEGRNRPEQFLTSIREQLIQRYQLQNTAADDLPTLLEKASQKLATGARLIIVVDALDEVEQEPGYNLLYLPTTLPDRVYFVLTRRPYILEKKRLLSPGVPFRELDLREEEYMKLSYIDIKDYIGLFLQDPEHQENLQKWIQDRNTTAEGFVEQVAVKSQNNFMYLRYLLPAIANGQYNNLELKQLPNGLQEYYQNHWVRMEMESAPNEFKVIILFILKEIKTPITSSIIADIAEQDKYDVEKLLERWVEYVPPVQFLGAMCYKIYHTSFAEFLERKKELERERKLFKEVNRRIAEYFRKYRQSKKEAGQSNG
ncbi:NACHT domain-containing protein [Kamptonema sp. UHCC 0994]|uniref:NACHT domain-containing protein n=1 Tax=Kamptonema sp. UHCC 0994 TaxID=3031329 RepID=UPI0023B8E58B|nr:NACHT domain-containing protein [Kamptonema sp. UHCC 0994]MDF0552032.1 NACHT domain-containing protein [Kamptonema sp. UHCC 0994]